MTADTGSSRDLREAVDTELARHQGLRGPMDDSRPDVWQNRCECGWDDGDETPGWRERYRLHLADAILSLPEVAALIGLRERVEALADEYGRTLIAGVPGAGRVVAARLRAAVDAPASPAREDDWRGAPLA